MLNWKRALPLALIASALGVASAEAGPRSQGRVESIRRDGANLIVKGYFYDRAQPTGGARVYIYKNGFWNQGGKLSVLTKTTLIRSDVARRLRVPGSRFGFSIRLRSSLIGENDSFFVYGIRRVRYGSRIVGVPLLLAQPTRPGTIEAERMSARKVKKWKRKKHGADSAGRSLRAKKRGASLIFTVSGRNIGLVLRKGRKMGALDVTVDGKRMRRVMMYSSGNDVFRSRVPIARNLSPGRHTVQIKLLYKRVYLDAVYTH